MTVIRATLALAVSATAADPLRPTPAEVERRFYAAWLEEHQVKGGVVTTDPEELSGNEFTPGVTWVWGRRGELSSGPACDETRVDAAADPMRVDFVTTRPQPPAGGPPERRVLPCIFKFDGHRLVLAVGQWQSWRPPGGGDYPGRPNDFTSTKENGAVVQTVRPSSHYAQD